MLAKGSRSLAGWLSCSQSLAAARPIHGGRWRPLSATLMSWSFVTALRAKRPSHTTPGVDLDPRAAEITATEGNGGREGRAGTLLVWWCKRRATMQTRQGWRLCARRSCASGVAHTASRAKRFESDFDAYLSDARLADCCRVDVVLLLLVPVMLREISLNLARSRERALGMRRYVMPTHITLSV